MSHDIEKAVFSAREGAGWTGLGQPIPAEFSKDPRKIAEICGATYTVIKEDVFTLEPNGLYAKIDNRKALVRDDNREVLEVVSVNRYHLDNRQPVDIFESFRDELAKESLEISHAAVLRGGRIVTVCAALKDASRKIGNDASATDVYVTGSTGYDRLHGSQYFYTGIRTVCANTMRMGMADAERAGKLYSIRASQKLGEHSLRALLGAAMGRVDSETAFLAALQSSMLTDDQATQYFADILDIDQSMLFKVDSATGKKLISSRAENQLNALRAAYKQAPGAMPGSLYGALQAVTYFVDHEGAVRDTCGDGKDAARVASAMFGNGAAVKAKAVKLAREFAMAA